MKKLFAAILAMMLIVSCVGAALADVISPYATPTYVRTGPGLGYKIVDKIYVGNTYTWGGSVRTDERGVDWYDVYYSGGYGWVSSLHANLVGSGSGNNHPNPPAKSGGSIHPFEQPTWIRTGPGLGYKIVDKIYVGNSYTWGGSTSVDDRGVAWYDVHYTDSHGVSSYGWVSSLQADLY